MYLQQSFFLKLYRFILLLSILICIKPTSFAQTTVFTVSGKVIDETNLPVPGVAVIVKDSQNGTFTNINGEYQLEKVVSTDVLVFSMVGFTTREVKVEGNTIINIILQTSAESINEVVVTGYQSQRKVDLTGAVANISSSKLMKSMPFSTEQALKGKFAGVQIMNDDGAPGGGIIVKIRGASSITAGSAPLYVIDGFPYPVSDDPYNNPLASISPNAIQSISVLKDVSSTAIYGAQGANGVVLITTKKGQEGQSQISFKASLGISTPTHGIDMLGPKEYMQAYMRDMYMTGRWQNSDFYEDYKNQIWKTAPERFNFYPDFCLHNSLRQNYELSYLGGSNRIRNSTTFSYSDDDGIAVNTGFKKFFFVTNTLFKLSPNLELSTNISYEHSKRSGAFWVEGNIFNEIQTFSPLIPQDWTFQQIDDNLYYTGKMDNPWRKLNDIDYSNIRNNFFGQAELQWNFLKNWFVKGSFGVLIPKAESKKFVPTTIMAGYNNGGLATYGTVSELHLRSAFQLGFNKNWNNFHKLSANFIFEAKTNESELFSQDYSHFNADLGWHGIYSAESGNHVTPPDIRYEQLSMLSTVLMANYSYKERYLAKFSLRADASSKFAPKNRWGFFPSGAVAWRISEEKFFQNLSWLKKHINNLKLRFSYGEVGNDQILPYQYINTLSATNRYGVFGDKIISALYTNRMINDKIGWEVTKEFNGGIDLDMFNNRLNISLDLYIKKTTDMLLNQHLPMLSGFKMVTRNIGSVQNKGIEFSIGGQIIDKKNITWTANFNISSNKSKVLSLGDEDIMLESRHVGIGNSKENVLIEKGLPLGLFYGMQIEGIRGNWNLDNNAVGESTWWTSNSREYPYGFVSFADINGDGKVTMDDRIIIGNVNPKFIGGLNTTFRYKFIEIFMDFTWSYGNDIINGNFYNLMNHGNIHNRSASYYHHTWFGDNPEGTFTPTGPIDWLPYMKDISNSEIVEDGSFLKMNNLALTFHLPSKWLNLLKIHDLSFTYSISNVFCITKYSGYDPEVSSGGAINNRILSGVDLSSYPYARTHLFSVNFKF